MSTLLCAARRSAVRTHIRSWQLPSATGLADTVSVDTTLLNMALRDDIYDYSINCAYNGNFISPVQSRIYFDRRYTVDDVLAQQYEPFIVTPRKLRFYHTNIPYSRVAYSHGFTSGHDEHAINFLFTGNITRRFNLGFQIDYLKGYGHYADQEAMNLRGALFWTYNGKHYSQQAAFTWTNLNNFENGGIADLSYLTSRLRPEDYPTQMHGMSEYKYLSGYLNHYYSITRDRQVNDSVTISIPLLTFRHLFEANQSNRRYAEHDARTGYTRDGVLIPYYDTCYLSTNRTNDRTSLLTLRNTLSVTFEEEYNRVLRFGAQAYAYIENQRFLLQRPDTTDLQTGRSDYDRWTHNLFVGGTIYKKTGRYVRYDVDGDVCVLGYKIGQFHANANIDTDFPIGKERMYVSAHAYISNTPPSFYHRTLYTNHVWRDTTLRTTLQYGVGGDVRIPTRYVQARVGVKFENIQNPIYYERRGQLRQLDGHVQVLQGDVDLNFRSPWICLDNTAVLQFSSSDCMPLPLFSLYSNLYYHGWWLKRAVEAHIGVDCRYFTSYYSQVLDPASGQFCIQQPTDPEPRQKIGNYPVLDLYANFYVKLIHLKFFVAWTHLNNAFMPKNTHRLLMPSYPMNDWIIRAGASFHFYK